MAPLKLLYFVPQPSNSPVADQSARSEPGQQPHLSSTTIPDLTNGITRPDDWQYCEAGGFGDVFRCQYTSAGGIREVRVPFSLSWFLLLAFF